MKITRDMIAEARVAMGAVDSNDNTWRTEIDGGKPSITLHFHGHYSIDEVESMLTDMRAMQLALDAGKFVDHARKLRLRQEAEYFNPEGLAYTYTYVPTGATYPKQEFTPIQFRNEGLTVIRRADAVAKIESWNRNLGATWLYALEG